MTETWLTDKHQHWKDTTALNNNFLKMHTVDRSDRPGGGLAFIHRSKYPRKEIQHIPDLHSNMLFGNLMLRMYY